MSRLGTLLRRDKAGPDVAVRAQALRALLDVGSDRLDPEAAEQARLVLDRTDERLAMGLDHTVVAFAGATGSGKSSLFNAVAGAEVSQTGVRRPTTSRAAGLVIGEGGDDLLDWLAVPRRHRLDPSQVPTPTDARGREMSLDGLVLLDLPDHDSTAVAHRMEVDRLVRLVDLLVWVVDPQKYADEALHAGYLQKMADHADVMMLALNQVDRLPAGEVDACVADLRRLLAADGLPKVPVLAVSARTGAGLPDLHAAIGRAVTAREIATARVVADLDTAVKALASSVGERELDPDSIPGRKVLVDALADAAGVPAVVRAVGRSYRRDARQRTGWPLTRWVGRLRRDPLRVLHLGRSRPPALEQGSSGGELERTSLPAPTHAQRAKVAIATRKIATTCSEGLPQRWADAVRTAVTPPATDLTDSLDQAVARVDLPRRRPLWWSGFGLVQLLLVLTFVVGAVWLGGLAGMAYLQLPDPATPLLQVGNLLIPLPTVLLIGGLLAGPVLALLATPLVMLGARRRRRITNKALRRSVDRVATVVVLDQVAQVLSDHRAARGSLTQALRR